MKNQRLSKLKGQGAFRTKQAQRKGISPRMLHHYVKKKRALVRLGHGLYAFPENLSFDFESLIKEKLKMIPQAIVGLESALKFYDLTDEAPRNIHLIVPLSNVPKRKVKDVKFYRVKDTLYKKAIKKINGIPVTSIERTLIDLLRTQKLISMVLKIMFTAQKKGVPINISKMKRLAIDFRVKGHFGKLIEAYL